MSLKLKYFEKLIDSTFKRFHASKEQNQSRFKPADSPCIDYFAFQRSEISGLRALATKRPWKENRSCNTNHFTQLGKSPES